MNARSLKLIISICKIEPNYTLDHEITGPTHPWAVYTPSQSNSPNKHILNCYIQHAQDTPAQ